MKPLLLKSLSQRLAYFPASRQARKVLLHKLLKDLYHYQHPTARHCANSSFWASGSQDPPNFLLDHLRQSYQIKLDP